MSISRLRAIRSPSNRSSEYSRISPREQTGEVGLGEAEQPSRFGLGEVALLDDIVDAGDQFGFHDVRVGVLEVGIGRGVAAAGFDGSVGYGHPRTYRGSIMKAQGGRRTGGAAHAPWNGAGRSGRWRMFRHGLAAEAAKRILPWRSGTACAVIGATADGWAGTPPKAAAVVWRARLPCPRTWSARSAISTTETWIGCSKRWPRKPAGGAVRTARRLEHGARGKAAPVTAGQEKLILAASEAGLTPSAIAREFRLSRAQVEGVLAGGPAGPAVRFSAALAEAWTQEGGMQACRHEGETMQGGHTASGAAGMSLMIEQVARIRIELRELEPMIWRRVDVPLSSTLEALHHVIQAAFRWQNYHLYEFYVGERVYGVPLDGDAFDGLKIHKASAIRLKTVVERGVERFLYVYDFGDDWRHDVIVEEVRDGAGDAEYPAFVDGARRCPPEDVGGPPGFNPDPSPSLRFDLIF